MSLLFDPIYVQKAKGSSDVTFLQGPLWPLDAVICFSKEINHLSKPEKIKRRKKERKNPGTFFLIYLLTISEMNSGPWNEWHLIWKVYGQGMTLFKCRHHYSVVPGLIIIKYFMLSLQILSDQSLIRTLISHCPWAPGSLTSVYGSVGFH